uniref:Uncharacterized protein n=1 Tax=Ciona intestinalis TaxID=7719 RepID=H2XSV4_CIOIN
MLMPLANTEALTLATLVWWLVFYTPRNAFQVTTQWFPVSVVTMLLKELIRTKKIIKGIIHLLFCQRIFMIRHFIKRRNICTHIYNFV